MHEDDDDSVDVAMLDRLQEDLGGAEPMAEVLGTFLEETPTLLAQVREALAAGDHAQAHRLAHSLKSTAAAFGAMRVSRLSARLERAAKEAPGEAPALAEALAEAWARARPALEARWRALS